MEKKEKKRFAFIFHFFLIDFFPRILNKKKRITKVSNENFDLKTLQKRKEKKRKEKKKRKERRRHFDTWYIVFFGGNMLPKIPQNVIISG